MSGLFRAGAREGLGPRLPVCACMCSYVDVCGMWHINSPTALEVLTVSLVPTSNTPELLPSTLVGNSSVYSEKDYVVTKVHV